MRSSAHLDINDGIARLFDAGSGNVENGSRLVILEQDLVGRCLGRSQRCEAANRNRGDAQGQELTHKNVCHYVGEFIELNGQCRAKSAARCRRPDAPMLNPLSTA